MTKKPSDSAKDNSNDEPLADLSSLDFGPAWARKDSGKKHQPRKTNRGDGSDHKTQRGPRKGKPRQHGGQSGRGDGRRQGGGKPYRGRNQERESRKPSTPPAEGVTARIMPIEEGMDGMAKEITATGRTHSVFDLAWLVLGGSERYHVIFETEDEALFKCQKDHSVWLTREECLRHFWSSGLVQEFYQEEVIEGEAPTGNFQSVARCGLSGKLIGPPNHHSYQQTLMELHRERFGSMPLERYKSKIKVEHGEEAVAQWIEQEKKQTHWRAKILEKDTPKPEEKAEQVDSEKPTQQVEEVTPEAELPTMAESSASSTETELKFSNRREVEQHFIEHGFQKAYYSGKSVSTPGNIPAQLISPSLLATMRETVAEEKRYPGKLASFLCRQMTGRHLAVFKWKKRLHCGPARPKHVPDDMVMADRPSTLFHWVLDHPSGDIETMWKECLPAEVDDETRHAWYHDLHWLINEGVVLLFSDGTLHAAKELKKNQPAEKPAQKSGKPEAPEQAQDPAPKDPPKSEQDEDINS